MWLVQSIDFDGGREGKTWSLHLFTTRPKALECVTDIISRKGWDDQVWRPYAEWIDEKHRLDPAWDRWSNNKDRMVVVLRPLEPDTYKPRKEKT